MVLPCKGLGLKACELDLPSLMPSSVAGCGRLHLGVANWATSLALLQVVDNLLHKRVIVDFSQGAPGYTN